MNSGYVWGLRQAERKKNSESVLYYEEKKLRKQAKKKLLSNQQPGRYVHIMDDEMFDSICGMLKSEDRRDKVMAHDIILSSKMSIDHMNYFIHNYSLMILNGVPEDIDYIYTWTGPTSSHSII